jgi:hypothetical protein
MQKRYFEFTVKGLPFAYLHSNHKGKGRLVLTLFKDTYILHLDTIDFSVLHNGVATCNYVGEYIFGLFTEALGLHGYATDDFQKEYLDKHTI